MLHNQGCFAPLSDDDESCYDEFDREEPDAADDDFENPRTFFEVSVYKRY